MTLNTSNLALWPCIRKLALAGVPGGWPWPVYLEAGRGRYLSACLAGTCQHAWPAPVSMPGTCQHGYMPGTCQHGYMPGTWYLVAWKPA